ncbi:hypothetical protein HY620_02460 [Candidatus Uhrbacteria bacterium]|nr:hypothetical protein [Candidatus Uhrbacteria bacterium]
MHAIRRVTLFFLLLNVGAILFLNVSSIATQKAMSAKLANVFAENNEVPLAQRIKKEHCEYDGALPDPECTPGAVFPRATREEICTPGYSKSVRNVSVSLKKDVYKAYGVSYPQSFGSYECDHHIPLALGGNNSIANLFPQPADPYPGFREKDVVEIFLHEEVCASRIDLIAAQRAIARNWVKIYNNLSRDTVDSIRSRYRNWSN